MSKRPVRFPIYGPSRGRVVVGYVEEITEQLAGKDVPAGAFDKSILEIKDLSAMIDAKIDLKIGTK